MKKNESIIAITPIALEYYNQRSFEMVFDVFNSLSSTNDEIISEYISIIGSEEFYDSLKYHQNIIYSALLTKNYELLENYFIWKYSVYKNRGVNIDCFLQEYKVWKETVSNYLYLSHASEINFFYDYLILNHDEFKKKAYEINIIGVNDEYKELFEELLESLLRGDKKLFFNLIQNSLGKFDNNIFLLIENLINPLLYKIGQMWQLNEINVAKEHLATSIVDEVVNYFSKIDFSNNTNRLKIITSTVGEETHNLGIKIVGNFLENNGFSVKNLTSKLSKKDLINSIYELNPDVVLLSITLSSNIALLHEIVKELKENSDLFTGKIVVGGQGLDTSSGTITIKEADFYSKNLEDLKSYLNSYKNIL